MMWPSAKGHLPKDQQRARDAAILALWRSGHTQEAIAAAVCMSASGVSRALARLGARSIERAAHETVRPISSRPRQKPGRKAFWPDCPPHLRRDYLRVRAIIGSRAAREQLLAAAQRAAL